VWDHHDEILQRDFLMEAPMELTFAQQLNQLGLIGRPLIEQAIDTGEAKALPEPDEAEQVVHAVWSDLFGMLTGTELEDDVESIAWDVVNIWHRAAERRTKHLDRLTDDIRLALEEQDGTELTTLKLEELTAKAEAAQTAMQSFEAMREHAASLYASETGSSWRPASGPGRINHLLTSAVVNGKAFLAARREARLKARTPEGTMVVFSGGRLEFPTMADAETFGNNLMNTLDLVRGKLPDMVLVHGGDTKGLDRLAARWAETHKVPQVTFQLDHRLGKRAGFARNKQLLSTKPRLVIAFQGSGVAERLVIDAKERNIQVVDRRGPLGTKPAKDLPMQQAA
jgi:YspA, cpYpsA-related SLOG family